ncbi:MAG: DUF6078 family protein [Bacteroidales bacterium]|nr:DUF6078 family protein [Bacteroidales bacterium]
MAYSFRNAYSRIPRGDSSAFREKVMAIFGVTCRDSFYSKLNGEQVPTVEQDRKLRELFAGYGITEIYDN